MASLLFKEMKGLNFSCSSPASTAAICATIDGSSLISSGSGRAIDRYNPHLRDPRRTKPVKPPALLPPQLPPSSKTKKKKKTNNKSSEEPNSTNFVTINNSTITPSPGSSTRFLLNSDVTLSHDHVFAEPQFLSVSSLDKDHQPSSSSSSSSSSSIITTVTNTSVASSCVTASDGSGDHAVVKPENQVVVLRVSLHCKGCEGKVRKHISKMEGVKSFFIDFAAKKVTVVGDVTPLGVLNSISKVKSAQFWPSPGDSSS